MIFELPSNPKHSITLSFYEMLMKELMKNPLLFLFLSSTEELKRFLVLCTDQILIPNIYQLSLKHMCF